MIFGTWRGLSTGAPPTFAGLGVDGFPNRSGSAYAPPEEVELEGGGAAMLTDPVGCGQSIGSSPPGIGLVSTVAWPSAHFCLNSSIVALGESHGPAGCLAFGLSNGRS